MNRRSIALSLSKYYLLLSLLLGTEIALAIEWSNWKEKLFPFHRGSYVGLGLGLASIDIGNENFNVQGQGVSIDIENSPQLSLYWVLPYSDRTGVELALIHAGAFEFEGNLTGLQNFGRIEGEQKYQGALANIYFQDDLGPFAYRLHLGAMQTILTTEGEVNPVGLPSQSLDYTENSTNMYFAFETNKIIFDKWSIGPSISIINAGDQIHSFSLKLSRKAPEN